MKPGNRRIDVLATGCLFGLLVCWGIVPMMLRYLALPGHVPDGWTANGWRYPFSAMLYIPYLVMFRRRGLLTRGVLRKARVPIAVNIVAQCGWAWAPYYLDASLMSFLSRMTVLWSGAIAMILFADERVLGRSLRFWAGMMLAVGGFAGIALGGGRLGTGASAAGLAIITGCALFFALYGISVRHYMRNIDPRLSFGVISLGTGVGMIALMIPLGEPASILHMPLKAQIVLFVSAFMGIAAGHLLFYVALQRIGAAISSSVQLVAPLLTALLAGWLLGERMSPVQWLSGGVLLVGSFLLVWAQERVIEAQVREAARRRDGKDI